MAKRRWGSASLAKSGRQTTRGDESVYKVAVVRIVMLYMNFVPRNR